MAHAKGKLEHLQCSSISDGDTWLHHAVIISLAEENTCLHGTAEPWMGKISMAKQNSISYQY
jgi:hypothetical protein